MHYIGRKLEHIKHLNYNKQTFPFRASLFVTSGTKIHGETPVEVKAKGESGLNANLSQVQSLGSDRVADQSIGL